MKLVLGICFSLLAFTSFGKSVSGTITLQKGLESEIKGGTLFVFAKNAGSKAGDGQMPIAVYRLPNPKFPAKFELSESNAMVPGTPFEGPFSIYARYSPTGDATDKSGPQGASEEKKAVKPGDKAVKIELKKK